MPRKSHLFAALAGVAVIAVPIAVATSANAGEPPEPALRLVAATPTVTAERYGDDPTVWLDLGANVIAGPNPFEINVARKSYAHPIVATQVIRKNGAVTKKVLPKGLVKDFGGLDKFLHVTIANAAGKKLVNRDQTFCPNGQSVRTRPDAPSSTHYPQVCGQLPFSLATVWGVEKGWGLNSAWGDFRGDSAVELPDGTYTATVSINKAHRDAFGIPANKATVSVKLIVRTIKDPAPGVKKAAAGHEGHDAAAHAAATKDQPAGYRAPGHDASALAPKGRAGQPNKARPVGKASVPATAPRPDLRSLPAWQIELGPAADDPGAPGTPGHEYLSFAANVWNAGPGPLVVDGFRRPGADLMDSYQYFYDAKGKQVGYAPAGTMEWDPRPGHTHWHFTDFATYRLLDASKKIAVRSGKEAFCLAPTDPVDLTAKNALWRPDSTDLSTACGGLTAVAVRESLPIGWGDTYSQSLPGQSFDVTGLANGTYYIEVKANPANKLFETSTANNTSLRQVILGGKPGARTVKVPPYQLVNAP
jgi:hypothetical protein